MSPEEQDAVLGRAVRNHRQISEKLSALMSEAHTPARLYGRIASVFDAPSDTPSARP